MPRSSSGRCGRTDARKLEVGPGRLQSCPAGGALPLYGQHDAVNSAADAQQSNLFPFADKTVFDCQGERHWQSDRARIAEPGIRDVVALHRQSQRLEHQLAMRAADLVANRTVE